MNLFSSRAEKCKNMLIRSWFLIWDHIWKSKNIMSVRTKANAITEACREVIRLMGFLKSTFLPATHSVVSVGVHSNRYRFKFCNLIYMSLKYNGIKLYETQHEKKSPFWHVRQMKTQISLRTPQSDLSSMFAWRNCILGNSNCVPSEDFDQTAQMRSLIRFFTGRTCRNVRLFTLRFTYSIITNYINIIIL